MKTQQTTIAEVQLIYKSKVKASDRKKITCGRGVYKIFVEKCTPNFPFSENDFWNEYFT